MRLRPNLCAGNSHLHLPEQPVDPDTGSINSVPDAGQGGTVGKSSEPLRLRRR